ncbi:MAG: hypothetical protein KatS3mg115_2268 [Candidatus Poribacteria bacterium]|nr:MAG: hypothetical protein KatS3mg115_2268 [Candidatus Poribacteria bacterium]
MTGLPPGTYRLIVRSKGYETRTDASVVVVEEAVTEVAIPLRPASGWRNPYVRSMAAIVAGGILLILVMMRNRVRYG